MKHKATTALHNHEENNDKSPSDWFSKITFTIKLQPPHTVHTVCVVYV